MSIATGKSGRASISPLDFQKRPEGTDPISKFLPVSRWLANAKILRFQLGLVKDTLPDILPWFIAAVHFRKLHCPRTKSGVQRRFVHRGTFRANGRRSTLRGTNNPLTDKQCSN